MATGLGGAGCWTTRSYADPALQERASGIYLRADPNVDIRMPPTFTTVGLIAVRRTREQCRR